MSPFLSPVAINGLNSLEWNIYFSLKSPWTLESDHDDSEEKIIILWFELIAQKIKKLLRAEEG